MGRGIGYKREVVRDLAERFSTAQSIVLVDFSGISVAEVTELRNKARGKNVDYIVAKNKLIKRVIAGTPMECLSSDLAGPTALGIGYDGSLESVKLLFEATKNLNNLKIKGGFVDGEYASAADVEAIAKLPGKSELIAKFMGALQSPITRLLFALNSPISGLVRTLDAIKKKKEGGDTGAS
ncbi:MAG: 50S ribosomal protein L10 [Candidatus Coatesbacteria bacterium]|nr:50S ribosomal protein L10 [Candidatus Coatesbacteria bacterium]